MVAVICRTTKLTEILIMILKDIHGKTVKRNFLKYKVDWNKKCRSNFQFEIKQFLKTFWMNHVVYEEMPVPGSRMTIDLFNMTKRIAVEIDGKQHDEYSEFFHGSRSKYRQQIIRDVTKEEFCQSNNFELLRIIPEDVPYLSRQYILDKLNIDIL